MTDQQTYAMLDGTPMLTIERQDTLAADLLIKLPIVSDHDSVRINPHRLLAMIDTIAPDAMRGYLRERSDYLDSPDESCSTLEDMLPADLAVKAARYRIDAVPEADSPEDVDEHPDPVEQLRESGRQLGEAWRAFTEGVRAGTFGTDR